MAVLNVNLTRIEGLNMKRSLKTAKRGHKLLKDKLDELVKKFLDLVKENEIMREKTEQKLEEAYKSFVMAKAVLSEEYMGEALMVPKQRLAVEIDQKNVMSVKIPEYKIQKEQIGTQGKEGFSYGLAFTTVDLDNSLQNFAEVSRNAIRACRE